MIELTKLYLTNDAAFFYPSRKTLAMLLEVSRIGILPVWPVLEVDKQMSRNKNGQVTYLRFLNDDIVTRDGSGYE